MRAWLLFAPLVCCSARIDDPNLGAVPPAPEAGATTSTSVTTFALSALLLGDQSRDGTVRYPQRNIWTAFGYDIDHRVSLAWSPDVCTPTPGNFVATQVDGLDGIDNAFGAGLLDDVFFGTGTASLTDDATKLIGGGAWTLQIRVAGLSGDATQIATGLSAETFVSGDYGGPPAFDGTTSWPVRPSTRVPFHTVYVDDGTAVLRDAEQPLVLPIQLNPPAPVTLTLRVHVPIVTFDLRSGSGTIAGVLDTQEALDTARVFAGELGSCSFFFEGDVRGAQDILIDGSNAPNVACDAISIGLGFTAKPVGNPPETGTDPAPIPDPCAPDASLDGGADAG